ncbi:aminotransferase class IV [Candidatus Woesearchaeota archaeon]|nr:aminotransferase class IV [Candidatus Woesearchaeota archaeon]
MSDLETLAEITRAKFPAHHTTPLIPAADHRFLQLGREEMKAAILGTIIENYAQGFLKQGELVYVRPNAFGDEKEGLIGVADPNTPRKMMSISAIIDGLGVPSLAHHKVIEVTSVNVKRYLDSAPKEGARVQVFEEYMVDRAIPQHIGLTTFARMRKLGANYGYGLIAKNTALSLGYDETLLTTSNWNVLEGGGENAFAVIGGKLYTPPLTESILPGTKRGVLLEIANLAGIRCHEETIPLTEFMRADAALFTGTWCGVAKISYVHWLSQGKSSNYDSNNEIACYLSDQYQHVIHGSSALDARFRSLSDRIRTKVELR